MTSFRCFGGEWTCDVAVWHPDTDALQYEAQSSVASGALRGMRTVEGAEKMRMKIFICGLGLKVNAAKSAVGKGVVTAKEIETGEAG